MYLADVLCHTVVRMHHLLLLGFWYFLANDGCFVSLWRRGFWWFWCNNSGIIWSWLAKHCWLTCKSQMCVSVCTGEWMYSIQAWIDVSPWKHPPFFCFLESSLADVRLDGSHIIIFHLSLRLSVTVTMVTIKPCTTAPSPVSSRKAVTPIRKWLFSESWALRREDLAGMTDGDSSAFYSTVVSWQPRDTMEARLSQIVCHGNRWLAVEDTTVSERGHIFRSPGCECVRHSASVDVEEVNQEWELHLSHSSLLFSSIPLLPPPPVPALAPLPSGMTVFVCVCVSGMLKWVSGAILHISVQR